MKNKALFEIAYKGVQEHSFRSLLTVLGIVIGIAAVVLIMSLGKSTEKLILDQVSSVGTHSIFIEPGPGDDSGVPTQTDFEDMTIHDIRDLERLPFVEYAIPYIITQGLMSRLEHYLNADIVGTEPQTVPYDNVTIESGRFFDDTDVRGATRVVVIGSTIADELFPNENPIGKRMKIKKTSFEVIGVLEEQGSQFFMDYDKRVYIPYTSMQQYIVNIDHFYYFGVSILKTYEVNDVIPEIRTVLRENRDIDNPNDDLGLDNFAVRTQEQAENILGTVTVILQLLLTAIAAISLLVGGIGIMNIMLVSVSERTKEVGLRLAIGARKLDIRNQFLTEALMLTGVGAVIGMIFGGLLAWGAQFILQQSFSDWTFVLPVSTIALAIGVALAVGVIFGVYPAVQASRLNPVEALRKE